MSKRALASRTVLSATLLIATLTCVGLNARASGSAEAPPAPQSFVGYWRVHGSQLFIDSLTYATSDGHTTTDWYGIRIDADGLGAITDLLTLSLSTDKTRMTVTTVGVSYMDGQSGTSASVPNPTENFVRGDSYVLVFVHPHLMKEIDIHTRHQVVGNPYWCGQGLASQYEHFCGA
jgi:hypothetical protein